MKKLYMINSFLLNSFLFLSKTKSFFLKNCNNNNKIIVGLIATLILMSVVYQTSVVGHAAQKEVNIYSYRQPVFLEKILKDFTAQTGIKTNIVFAKNGLVERMQIEGDKSPVDILLSSDIGIIQRAAIENAQPVNDIAELYEFIPPNLRSKDGKWFALTMRARVIYASKDLVKQNVETYESLADPQWKNKICTRSGQHPYNLGLIASMIVHHGKKETKKFLIGLKNNLARKPGGNDRAQVKGIYAGECHLSIGNTYYMGLMLNNDKAPEQKKWAAAVKLHFAKFENGGTHVNISGMMMAKYSPNPKSAKELMRYLISPKVQRIYAKLNHEYPVRRGINPSKLVASWGKLDVDNIDLTDIADNISAASRLVDEVGFDM